MLLPHLKRFFGSRAIVITAILCGMFAFSTSLYGQSDCKIGPIPIISFRSNSNLLLPSATAALAALATKMKGSPSCKVIVSGNGNSSKTSQQLSWDHTDKVISYLSEAQGIDRSRFIFQYGMEGLPTLVTLRAAGADDEGPSDVAPPFPSLRKK